MATTRVRLQRQATPLRHLRQARTISQRQMADMLAVQQQLYSDYERGKVTPSVAMQARIAAILGVSADALWQEGV